ncbi:MULTISPECIES: PilX N-terminal domain-containing pilus assembly protein [Cycloclasticus]|jgi:Tfp pilus assembly protein PilX|uniref:Type 4 fimbrial biogenesis protein PilX N-terminal domain-containing protein n=1 Tax=Cycloclasticus pugetii TaxID=34068 RepID=A0AB33Z1Q1_9GAMM|nr:MULTISPECIES: PilX N-terminal domain-containing pilus assembly protein [Cycloclasticus]ATI02118.1 hypothetical protein CPC19_01175 [Cycloclasticus sp. PY97N]EPD13135.1 hypothetical protein L196_05820 [Cycloclasticus pugetii]
MMKLNKIQPSLNNQKGVATLLVSIILLIGVTLITVFAARVGVMDQRISANEYRHKEAQAAADAALEQAAAFINENTGLYDGTVGGTYPWVECVGGYTSLFPCTNGSDTYNLAYDNDLTTLTTIEPLQLGATPTAVDLSSGVVSNTYLTYTNSGNVMTAIGTGESLDGTGNAYAQISYTQITLLTSEEVPPVMTPIIELGGTFTIVADPNGGGKGVPVSAWVATFDTSGGLGSWQTCQLDAFLDNSGDICSETLDDTDSWKFCDCDGDKLSEPGNVNYDIVQADPGDFPASVLSYLFPNFDSFQDVVNIADVELTNCSGLQALASGWSTSKIVTVDGDCTMPSNSIIGSRDGPLILVVSGHLKINANSDFYGIALGLSDVTLNGGVKVHGSLLAEDSTKLTTGGYAQVYDEFVLGSIVEDLSNLGLAKQKYSWTDIQP